MDVIDFRNLPERDRARMRLENRAAVDSLETAEIRMGGGVWVRPQDFACLASHHACRPEGKGQLFRFGQ